MLERPTGMINDPRHEKSGSFKNLLVQRLAELSVSASRRLKADLPSEWVQEIRELSSP